MPLQIKIPDLLHTCTQCSELPSNISTMGWYGKGRRGKTALEKTKEKEQKKLIRIKDRHERKRKDRRPEEEGKTIRLSN